jgi:hypothetical protein
MSHRVRQYMLLLSETLALIDTIRYGKPLGGVTGCSGLSWIGEGGGMGRHVVKSYLPTSIKMRESEDVDWSRV